MQWEVLVEQEFSWSLFQEQWSFYFQQCLLIGKGTNTAVIYIVLNQCHPWTYHTGINSHVGQQESETTFHMQGTFMWTRGEKYGI